MYDGDVYPRMVSGSGYLMTFGAAGIVVRMFGKFVNKFPELVGIKWVCIYCTVQVGLKKQSATLVLSQQAKSATVSHKPHPRPQQPLSPPAL